MPLTKRSHARRVLATLLIAVTPLGCDTSSSDANEPLDVAAWGKADGASGVLENILGDDAADDLLTAMSRAVNETRLVVLALEDEAERLEADNDAKQTEIANLVRAIEDRRDELEDDWNNARNAAIICAFLGCPAPLGAATLIELFESDNRLNELEDDLDDARQQLANIEDEIESHEERIAELRVELETLRVVEDDLNRVMFEAIVPDDTIPSAIEDEDLRSAFVEIHTLEGLRTNLAQQAAVLGQIVSSLATVNDILSDALDELTSIRDRADELVAQSQNRFFDLLKLFAANDPGAAAERWLENEVARRTTIVLEAAGLPADAFVDHLMGETNDDEFRAALLESLLTADDDLPPTEPDVLPPTCVPVQASGDDPAFETQLGTCILCAFESICEQACTADSSCTDEEAHAWVECLYDACI